MQVRNDNVGKEDFMFARSRHRTVKQAGCDLNQLISVTCSVAEKPGHQILTEYHLGLLSLQVAALVTLALGFALFF